MAGTNSTQPEQSPKKRGRLRWTRRIFLGWLLFVAALLVTRFVWGWLADRRVEAERAAIAARGEELDWAKLAPPSLAPEDNRVTYYTRAARAMNTGRQDTGYLRESMRVASLRGKHDTEIDSLVAANAQVFAYCRAARNATGTDWGLSHAAPFSTVMLAFAFGAHRELSSLLCLKAARQAQLGDSQGAVETLLDAETLARAVNEDTQVIGYLVSVAIGSHADGTAVWVAPSLAIEGQTTTAASRPATAQSVRQLIRVLLDHHPLAGLRQSLIAERAGIYSELRRMSTTGLIDTYTPFISTPAGAPVLRPPGICTWPLAPMHQAGIARMLHRYGQLIDAASQATMSLAAARLPPQLFNNPDSLELLALLVPGVDDPSARVIDVAYRWEARSRLAATALALRLYELEKGYPAKSLEELVPAYLPAVPADPFDSAGGPIRGLLSDARPRVYSFGPDMKDDGGLGGFSIGDGGDIVVYLRQADMPEPDVSWYTPPGTQPESEAQPASGPTEVISPPGEGTKE